MAGPEAADVRTGGGSRVRKARPAALLGGTALATANGPILAGDDLPPPVEAATPSTDASSTAAADPGAADLIEKDVSDMATVSEAMTETVETAAETGAGRAQAMFGDAGERAKTAFEKATKMFEDMLDLARGNVEAVVASGRIAAKGAESIAHEATEYSRKSLEQAQGVAKSYAAVRSPTDLLQLNQQLVRTHLDSVVGNASRMSESYVKLMSEIAEPISSRFSAAQEKMKGLSL